MVMLERRTDATVRVRSGETVEHVKVVNSDPEQPVFVVDRDARGWSIRECEAHGGKFNLLRGEHGVAHRFRAFGQSRFGIAGHETDEVPERVTNDLTISDFRVEDCAKSGVGAMAAVVGLTMRDGVIRDVGLDGITAYNDRNDLIRIRDVDVFGYANHGVHIGGNRAWVDGLTVTGGTHRKASALAVFNHVGKRRMRWVSVRDCFLDGDRHAIWGRDIDFLTVSSTYLWSIGDEVSGQHIYNDGGSVRRIVERDVVKA